MQTSHGYPLDHRDPEQTCEREQTAQSPPDIYHARIARLQVAADRSRAKREARKQRRNVG